MAHFMNLAVLLACMAGGGAAQSGAGRKGTIGSRSTNGATGRLRLACVGRAGKGHGLKAQWL